MIQQVRWIRYRDVVARAYGPGLDKQPLGDNGRIPTVQPGGNVDIEYLRRELAWRVREYPPVTWSAGLLTAVISSIDLQFGDPSGKGIMEINGTGGHLRLVH